MNIEVGNPPKTTDYLVIGSGFGGSVMAARLAGAGRTVCLLERGKAYPPGSFPRTPDGLAANFWDPSKGLHGMFNVWSFRGLDAIVSSGLGGGSLIYANVLLEKPPDWFSQPHPDRPGKRETWSFAHADLAPHYDAVRGVLQSQTIPPELVDLASPKTAEFLRGAGVDGKYAPLAVRFLDGAGNPAIGAPLPEAPYGSIFGKPHRSTCRMIGECDIGCNEGAKNSLDHTYLSMAFDSGASIHVRTEVRKIARLVDDTHLFEVSYVRHDEQNEGSPTDTGTLELHTIRAHRVILAAGSLGSTQLVLTNVDDLGIPRAARLPIGGRFCGNGDLLGFALPKGPGRDFGPTKGPVITAYRQFEAEHDSSRDRRPAEIRMYLQDGGFPALLTWVAKSLDIVDLARRLATEGLEYWWKRTTGTLHNNMSAEASHLLGGSGAMSRGMPILGMGQDVPDGRLFVHERGTRTLDCTWNIKSSKAYFEEVRRKMHFLTEALDADFRINPANYLNRVITVHPVGGCPADTSGFTGVVDGYGRMHSVPGMWIVDGSVFPGPIGANPSLTIAAFAERAAGKLLQEDLATPSPSEPFARNA